MFQAVQYLDLFWLKVHHSLFSMHDFLPYVVLFVCLSQIEVVLSVCLFKTTTLPISLLVCYCHSEVE